MLRCHRLGAALLVWLLPATGLAQEKLRGAIRFEDGRVQQFHALITFGTTMDSSLRTISVKHDNAVRSLPYSAIKTLRVAADDYRVDTRFDGRPLAGAARVFDATLEIETVTGVVATDRFKQLTAVSVEIDDPLTGARVVQRLPWGWDGRLNIRSIEIFPAKP
jgi:hypothetical protein